MPPELTPLLTYLKISFAQFAPFEAKYFARLKELLVFHQIIPVTQTVDRSNFSGFVKTFQGTVMHDPHPDGMPGENTLWALQKDWAGSRGLKLIKSGIPNDAFGGSHDAFILRSDVVPHYMDWFNEIHASGGVITSAGSLRDLTAPVSAGRSTTSMHYTGIALDLNTVSGMHKPASDAYVIERNGTTHWQVWNKVAPPNGTLHILNAIIYNDHTKNISTNAINTPVIDFTGIAAKHGFYPIGNRGCFPGDYMCAEWWHFQCEDVLVPYISQFGAELLTVYSVAQLSAHGGVWSSKMKIFKKDWF